MGYKIALILSKILLFIASAAFAWEGRIIFEDKFDGNSLDLNKWAYEEGCSEIYGPRNLQCYTRDNVKIRAGNLVITAKKERREDKNFTSGRIRQRGPGSVYGAYVARARFARGDHLWPAIWMLNAENTRGYEEIDIAEYRGQESESNNVDEAAHWGRAYNKLTSKGKVVTTPFDLSKDFHEYAVLWIPDRIEWYIDNEKYFNISLTDPNWTNNPSTIPCTDPVPFSAPATFILNVAVGGPFFENFPPMDLNTWSKTTMEVDWVRVYQA